MEDELHLEQPIDLTIASLDENIDVVERDRLALVQHERHVERVWQLAQRMGIRDKKRIRAFVQLYAAALRGLAIDALWPQSAADVKARSEEVMEVFLSWCMLERDRL